MHATSAATALQMGWDFGRLEILPGRCILVILATLVSSDNQAFVSMQVFQQIVEVTAVAVAVVTAGTVAKFATMEPGV